MFPGHVVSLSDDVGWPVRPPDLSICGLLFSVKLSQGKSALNIALTLSGLRDWKYGRSNPHTSLYL